MQKHVKTPRTLSSREFNQNVGKAKRLADDGPVTITDRGKPAFVLMKHEQYRRLTGKRPTLFDLVGQTEPEADFEFDPPRLGGSLLRPVDLD